MDIAVITYVIHPMSGARAPIELAKALQKFNHVTIYASDHLLHQPTVAQLRRLGIEIKFIKQIKFPIFGIIVEMYDLYKLLRNHRHQVISFHSTLSFLFAAKLTKIPIVSYYYGTQFNVVSEHLFPKNTITKLMDYLLNPLIYVKSWLLVHLPHRCVAISKYVASEAHNLYGKKMKYIYLGVNPTFSQLKKKKINSKIVHLLSVSRITPYKQFERLIDIVQNACKNTTLHFSIVGSSPHKKYVRYLQNKGGTMLTIHTTASESHLNHLYKKSDIYLSADRYLFFGLPILEAAAACLPVISFDYGASDEVIRNGRTGFVVKNRQEFLQKLQLLIKDQNRRQAMSEAAHIFSKQFTWDRCATKWQQYLEKATP